MDRSPADGWFSALQHIVEEKIRKAQEEGLFDDLPGRGKPLKLDDDSRVAPHLRASYRILKNAGILPPEMQVRKDIEDLRQLLNQAASDTEADQLVREINDKIVAGNIMAGFSVPAGMDQLYAEKVLERLGSSKNRYHLERGCRDSRKQDRSGSGGTLKPPGRAGRSNPPERSG